MCAGADFKIAELEREIAVLTGGLSPENRHDDHIMNMYMTYTYIIVLFADPS